MSCKEDVKLSSGYIHWMNVPSWSPSCHSHTGCFFLLLSSSSQSHASCPSSLGTQLYPASTFEADIQRHPRQRGVDDITQVHFLLFIEVQLPAPTRGKPERDELLSMEAI